MAGDGKREAITQSEFARRIGVSPGRVSQVKQRRFTTEVFAEGGKLWWPLAAWQWKAAEHPQAALQPAADAPEAPAEAAEPSGVVSLPAYKDHMARKAAADADLKEFELRQKRDLFRSKAEVNDALTNCGQAIRRRLDQIETWAHDLAPVSDPAELRGLLRDKARELEQGIADLLDSYAYVEGEPAEAGGEEDGDAVHA